MTSNRPMRDISPEDVECIEKAQNRLLRLYARQLTWRKVGDKLGINHALVWWFVFRSKIPVNPDFRRALGLRRSLPSERKPKARRVFPKVGEEGWEDYYFRKVKR